MGEIKARQRRLDEMPTLYLSIGLLLLIDGLFLDFQLKNECEEGSAILRYSTLY